MVFRDKPTLERGLLTNWLLGQLAGKLGALDPSVLVGDALAPLAGGWPSQPQAESTTFAPYTVLVTMPGQPSIPGGSRDDEDTWLLGYQLRSVGVPRMQADWVGDRARSAWTTLPKSPVVLGAASWRILHAHIRTLGPITVNKVVDPPWFELVDSVELTLTRT